MKCRDCNHLGWEGEHPKKTFFDWCDKINDSPDLDIERECRYFEPVTNASVYEEKHKMKDKKLNKEALNAINVVMKMLTSETKSYEPWILLYIGKVWAYLDLITNENVGEENEQKP